MFVAAPQSADETAHHHHVKDNGLFHQTVSVARRKGTRYTPTGDSFYLILDIGGRLRNQLSASEWSCQSKVCIGGENLQEKALFMTRTISNSASCTKCYRQLITLCSAPSSNKSVVPPVPPFASLTLTEAVSITVLAMKQSTKQQ